MVTGVPDTLKKAEAVAVAPTKRSSVICRGATDWTVLCHQPWIPVVAVVVISPLQVKLPVAPSTVQPVAPDPPAKLTAVAVVDPGPMFKVLAAPAKLTVVAVALTRLKVV